MNHYVINVDKHSVVGYADSMEDAELYCETKTTHAYDVIAADEKPDALKKRYTNNNFRDLLGSIGASFKTKDSGAMLAQILLNRCSEMVNDGKLKAVKSMAGRAMGRAEEKKRRFTMALDLHKMGKKTGEIVDDLCKEFSFSPGTAYDIYRQVRLENGLEVNK